MNIHPLKYLCLSIPNTQIFIETPADLLHRKAMVFSGLLLLLFPQILSSFAFHAFHINVLLRKLTDKHDLASVETKFQKY